MTRPSAFILMNIVLTAMFISVRSETDQWKFYEVNVEVANLKATPGWSYVIGMGIAGGPISVLEIVKGYLNPGGEDLPQPLVFLTNMHTKGMTNASCLVKSATGKTLELQVELKTHDVFIMSTENMKADRIICTLTCNDVTTSKNTVRVFAVYVRAPIGGRREFYQQCIILEDAAAISMPWSD